MKQIRGSDSVSGVAFAKGALLYQRKSLNFSHKTKKDTKSKIKLNKQLCGIFVIGKWECIELDID